MNYSSEPHTADKCHLTTKSNTFLGARRFKLTFSEGSPKQGRPLLPWHPCVSCLTSAPSPEDVRRFIRLDLNH